MDSVSETFYLLYFRLSFLEKKGNEFQKWFGDLAKGAYGADFEPVRPHGSQGDWKLSLIHI